MRLRPCTCVPAEGITCQRHWSKMYAKTVTAEDMLSGKEDKADKENENKRKRRNSLARLRRREREQVMRDCGLVKGKTSDGRTIWE